jgi:hypothetical protein
MNSMDSTTSLPGDFEAQDEDGRLVENEDLSYQQLREIYDDEEIERFIDIFSNVSSYVTCPNLTPQYHYASMCKKSVSPLRNRPMWTLANTPTMCCQTDLRTTNMRTNLG